MPRGFTEKESSYYRQKLIEVGSNLFSIKGLNGVSIDAIIKEVGIAKGSFYKFYKNKEDLCYDCLMKLEKDIRKNIEEKISKYKGTPGLMVKEGILLIPEIIKENPLISIFQNEKDLQALMLKVDPKKHEENFNGDSLFIGKLLKGSNVPDKEKESLTSLMWAVVLVAFNKNFFNGHVDDVIGLIADMSESHFNKKVEI